jgi:hypothetical protein
VQEAALAGRAYDLEALTVMLPDCEPAGIIRLTHPGPQNQYTQPLA